MGMWGHGTARKKPPILTLFFVEIDNNRHIGRFSLALAPEESCENCTWFKALEGDLKLLGRAFEDQNARQVSSGGGAK